MSPLQAAFRYLALAFQKAFGQAAGRRAVFFFILQALIGGLLAYGLISVLILKLDLRLESLFGIGLIVGVLLWNLSLLARQLSAELIRLFAPGQDGVLPSARPGQVSRYHLASPWISPSDEAAHPIEPALPPLSAWHYGLHLLLPFIAARGQRLEEAQSAIEILRQGMPLRWDPARVPVFRITRNMVWAGLVLGSALGTLAALQVWLQQGSSKVVLLQSAAWGLGLGFLLSLLFLIPSAIASAAYSADLLEFETSDPLAGRPGLLAALRLEAPAAEVGAASPSQEIPEETPPQA